MKKFGISCLAALILAMNLLPTAAAAAAPLDAPASTQSVERAEEVEWIFRTNPDGTREMRLWSVTYSVWRSDWIPVYP